MHVRKRMWIILGAIVALFAYREAAFYGFLPRPNVLKTIVPTKIDAIQAEVLPDKANVQVIPLPSSSASTLKAPAVPVEIWAWNANMAAIYANGGALTTAGSLMEKNGVRLSITRQDDTDQMRADQIAFANEYCQGHEPTSGAAFVTIMGDQTRSYIEPANDKLKALGVDCQLEVIDSFGFSRGEDQFMGPPEWKVNPQAAKGSLIAGAEREGDWNLAIRWAMENKIPVNTDDHTFDPDALNFVQCTYIEAPERYIAGYHESRPLKNNPSKSVDLTVTGILTWTPGDVTEAEKKGGLVSLMDSGIAAFQMPAVVIGLKKWDKAHAQQVAGMIAGAAEGADQVRSNPKALKLAGDLSAKVYKEKDGAYWIKYYQGVDEVDKAGLTVHLGGSNVSNLADLYQLFGLSGGPSLFKATYESWGNKLSELYPNLFKGPSAPASTISDTSYIKLAASKMEDVDKGKAETVTYSEAPIKNVTGHRDYQINFDTGLATIRPDSLSILDEVYNNLITERTKVHLIGFTDSSGNPESNRILSQQRAASVKAYLRSKGGIPDQRIQAEGRGQEEPVAPNTTAEGRAKNRRVAAILGL